MAQDMTVMVVGSGAREDAIASEYFYSGKVRKVVVAPGNEFMEGYIDDTEVIIDKNSDLKNPQSFLRIAQEHKPDIVDIAQDDALALGTVDLLEENGFTVFGPNAKAAKIEADKIWSRNFMNRHGISAPKYACFNPDMKDAINSYLRSAYKDDPNRLMYVKAFGLCGGKGALSARSFDQALERVLQMKHFGKAGEQFLIEDGLIGEEFSYYAIVDGTNYHLFRSAQDYKLSHAFDTGEQTGGMGAVSPAMVTQGIESAIENDIIKKAIDGMREEGNPFKGILYVGGIVVDGKPHVIEFNARLGDPEAQVILHPLKEGNYLSLVQAAVNGTLDKERIQYEDNDTRVCVVGAARGYPGDYSDVKGKKIHGIDEVLEMDDVIFYGAGIDVDGDDYRATGGRLFSIVGQGENVIEGRARAYEAISRIYIDGNNLHFRPDIGFRDVQRFWADR